MTHKIKILLSVSCLLFIVLITYSNLPAQETIERKKEKATEAAMEGIQTGYVVAFGRLIPPPYKVTRENNVILINNIQIFPRPQKKSVDKEKKNVVPELAVKKHELTTSIFEKYENWSKTAGVKEAKSRLENFLNSQSLIKSYQWNDETLIITYNDGDSEGLWLNTARVTHKSPSEIETENITIIFMQLQEDIKEGRLVAFGYDYTLTMPASDIDLVKDIILKSISNNEKRDLLLKKSLKKSFVEDLLSNQDSWLEGNR